MLAQCSGGNPETDQPSPSTVVNSAAPTDSSVEEHSASVPDLASSTGEEPDLPQKPSYLSAESGSIHHHERPYWRRIGWKTPLWILATYSAAFLIAIVHLSFALIIQNTPANGPGSKIRQSFVTTASTIQANAFSVLLSICLTTAFTQHLWYLLRSSFHKVAAIERLMALRSGPITVIYSLLSRESWVLIFISITMLTMQVIASFPPGAITVEAKVQQHHVPDAVVPTFNASGDGSNMSSVRSWNLFWLTETSYGDSRVKAMTGDYELKDNPRLANGLDYLAQRTILNRVADLPSPCGPNCTYSIEFVGPYLDCSAEAEYPAHNVPLMKVLSPYTCTWQDTAGLQPAIKFSEPAPLSIARLNFTTFNFDFGPGDHSHECRNGTYANRLNTTCIPSRVRYNVTNSFIDGEQRISVITLNDTIAPLVEPRTEYILPDNLTLAKTSLVGNPLRWIEDTNMMTLIGRVVSLLQGSYEGNLAVPDSDCKGGGWYSQSLSKPDGSNGIVAYSKLYNKLEGNNDVFQYLDVNGSELDSSPFTVSGTMLNEMLFNFTLSAITALDLWNTTVDDQIKTVSVNVYAFSNPLHLLLPYFITLVVTLPLAIIGLISLRRNGVPVSDGFLQILCSTRGSDALDKAAKRVRLGDEVPDELKNLEIRFGELVSHEGTVEELHMAGFGTREEIRPLKMGKSYRIGERLESYAVKEELERAYNAKDIARQPSPR